MKKIFLLLFFLFFALEAQSRDYIFRIDIEGNDIVSDAKIISKIKVRAGQSYNKNIINEDVKNLYATGFFETVEAEKEDVSGKTIIIFRVKEKPVLEKIVIEGARVVRKKKILESVDIEEGSFIDEYKMKESVRKIKDLYSEKGFSQTEVTYALDTLQAQNKVRAKFIINEKGILKIKEVVVIGNKAISASRIKRLMKAKQAWFLNRGVFKKDVLRDDVKRLTDFYKLKGFSEAKVDIDIEKKLEGIYLTVNIEEGRCYYVGELKIKGNKDVRLDEILGTLDLKKGDVFSEQTIYGNVSRIRELYVDKGYIFSQVEPFSFFNPKTERVDVTYKILENEIAYIEHIGIKGNIKTKDKVIRRELRVYPGERFDGKRVRKSKEKLENLGFFEEIRFSTEPGTKSNNIDLVVDVKEAKTGYFSFGGGYSSIDGLIGFAELRQRNFDYRNFSTFTGAGQDLSLIFSIGTLVDRYQLSFTNPWIFDIPVSFGFDLYKKGHQQDDDVGYAYEEDIRGGILRLGREFNDYLKGRVAYRFEKVKIEDIVGDATPELKAEKGTTDFSSGEVSLSYDSRDNIFSTSRGIYCVNTFTLFGGPFGGDKDFIKYFGRVSFYFPTINESVVELKMQAGIIDPFSDTTKVPIYERFFAGGASTVRGYRERKVGPIDVTSEDPLGGEAVFVSNIEYTYPLADFLKVATFFDTGNVWSGNSDFLKSSLMSSVGIGLRVKTPIGPVNIDYGWPLDTEPGEEEKEGRFHFNLSRSF